MIGSPRTLTRKQTHIEPKTHKNMGKQWNFTHELV